VPARCASGADEAWPNAANRLQVIDPASILARRWRAGDEAFAPAPSKGADTDRVLAAWPGLDAPALSRLHGQGVIAR
jgi:hypothetical protein